MTLVHHLLFGTRYPKTNFNASLNLLKERVSLTCHVFSGELLSSHQNSPIGLNFLGELLIKEEMLEID